MNKTLFCCLLVVSNLCPSAKAQLANNFEMEPSIGFSSAIQNNTLSFDIYGSIAFLTKKSKIESNGGYMFFRNKTEFAEVKNVTFSSHGLFVEQNYYLVKGLYAGIRTALNFNWIDKEARKTFDTIISLNSPTFFLGVAGFGNLGYHLKVSNNVGIKLQGQLGFHYYRISQGNTFFYFSNDVFKLLFGTQDKLALLSNLSLGITCKL